MKGGKARLFASRETKHISPLTLTLSRLGGDKMDDMRDGPQLEVGSIDPNPTLAAARQARTIMAKRKRGASVSDLPRRVAMDPTLPVWV
jgi:hypothetical protein